MGTLRQMEYLLAVVEEESFTRAAHRLSVSQATLSHQLKALEEAVGQPLVERLPGRVLPTQMGREYLPHAITALRSAAAARRAVMTGHDGEPVSLRLAVLPSLASGVLPGAIRAWRDAHPDAEVSMLEFLDGDRLPREMLRGVADLAVGPVPDGWPGEVYPLYREELVVVLPTDDVCADATGTPWTSRCWRIGTGSCTPRATRWHPWFCKRAHARGSPHGRPSRPITRPPRFGSPPPGWGPHWFPARP